MKIIIDIPKEFEENFNGDKFEESLQRARYDIHRINLSNKIKHLSGRYEIELLDMLTDAFENSEVVNAESEE